MKLHVGDMAEWFVHFMCTGHPDTDPGRCSHFLFTLVNCVSPSMITLTKNINLMKIYPLYSNSGHYGFPEYSLHSEFWAEFSEGVCLCPQTNRHKLSHPIPLRHAIPVSG